MDKQRVLNNIIQSKGVQKYGYTALFFFIFSFFVIFAIRPALSIAFTLKRQQLDLEKVNASYEANIVKIIELQTQLESIKKKEYLLTDAIPKSPQLNSILDSFNKEASNSSIVINGLEVSSIELTQNQSAGQLKNISLAVSTTATYTQAKSFIENLVRQRRLKTIKGIQIVQAGTGPENASASSQLVITFQLEGYYL